MQVTTYTNFDAIELAAQLEKHELLEMRRVAGSLYKTNKRYAQVQTYICAWVQTCICVFVYVCVYVYVYVYVYV